jgi:outer membrane protein assembly factor BamE (lipoprotein component of BamABCDE complex)
MITSILKKGAIGLAAVGALTMLLSSTPTPANAGIKVGDSVSYSWRSPLVNGMGRSSLEDFLGTPVLVEFWGTR